MRIAKKVYLGLLLLFMYAPIVVLIIFSFNESRSRGYWGGFTLDWYRELFRDTKIMRALPYIILSVSPKLRSLDNNLYEAALDLGASPVYAFFKVVLPEILPGIITGFILAFTLSIDDFVISFFTTGSGVSTLSVTIFAMARRGVNPKINALSTLMFAAVMLLLYVINKRDTAKLKA